MRRALAFRWFALLAAPLLMSGALRGTRAAALRHGRQRASALLLSRGAAQRRRAPG
jgi:hypothetical protein